MEQRVPAPARRKASPLRSAISFVLLAGAGAIFGYVVARGADLVGLLPDFTLSSGELLALALLIAPAWAALVFVHELGHLVGGALTGMRPLLLIVGPLKLTWIDGRLRAGLNRSFGLAGGVAAAVPDDDRDLVRRQMLMVAGGPGASLLLGVLALAVLPFVGGLPAALLSLSALVTLAIAVMTLLPMQMGGFYSDGARLLMLLRGGARAERMGAVAVIYGAAVAGRLREVPPGLVARATALPDGTLDDVGAAVLAYSWALARGEVAAAGRFIDHALAHEATCMPVMRPGLLAEGAYYLARHRGEAAAARGLFERVRGSRLVEPYDLLRVEGAVLLAEGRRDEALAKAEAGLAALAGARAGAMGALDEELLRDLRAASTMEAAA